MKTVLTVVDGRLAFMLDDEIISTGIPANDIDELINNIDEFESVLEQVQMDMLINSKDAIREKISRHQDFRL